MLISGLNVTTAVYYFVKQQGFFSRYVALVLSVIVSLGLGLVTLDLGLGLGLCLVMFDLGLCLGLDFSGLVNITDNSVPQY